MNKEQAFMDRVSSTCYSLDEAEGESQNTAPRPIRERPPLLARTHPPAAQGAITCRLITFKHNKTSGGTATFHQLSRHCDQRSARWHCRQSTSAFIPGSALATGQALPASSKVMTPATGRPSFGVPVTAPDKHRRELLPNSRGLPNPKGQPPSFKIECHAFSNP